MIEEIKKDGIKELLIELKNDIIALKDDAHLSKIIISMLSSLDKREESLTKTYNEINEQRDEIIKEKTNVQNLITSQKVEAQELANQYEKKITKLENDLIVKENKYQRDLESLEKSYTDRVNAAVNNIIFDYKKDNDVESLTNKIRILELDIAHKNIRHETDISAIKQECRIETSRLDNEISKKIDYIKILVNLLTKNKIKFPAYEG